VAEKLPPTNSVNALKKRDALQLLHTIDQNETDEVMNIYNPICEENDASDESDGDEALVTSNKDVW